MKLIIEDDEGRKTVVPIVREEITIGRQDGNTIKLTERNVSRKHARLVRDNGFLLIEDLGSYNGVRVNGDRIEAATKIKEGDLIEIGDYDLGIQGKFEAAPAGAAAPAARQTVPPGQVQAKPAAPKTVPPTAAPKLTPTQNAPVPAAPAPAPQPAAAPQQPAMPSASAGGATAIIRVSDIMKSAPQVEARDLQKNEMPRLVGLAGQVRGKEFYLMRTEVKFGRTEENEIVVDHQSVSRQHAKFVMDNDGWKVIDNKSANGVKVNGDEYGISAVKPGDTIELGHLKFRFCGPGEKFVVPPEKVEGEQQKGGMKPTTAELIAGAQAGRSAPSAAAPAKKGPPIAIIAGAAAVVVVAIVAIFVLKGSKKPEEDPKYQAEQGDIAFKKHDYAKAMEFYEQAVALNAPPPANMKKAAAEAKAEETYHDFQSALGGNDVDKAKALFEKCATESTYYCGKVTESGDQVKQKYAAKHLAAGNAAKAAGKNEQCLSEANAVLAFVPDNADAQALSTACQPQAAAPAAEPKREGPSPAQREAKASKLATEAKEKLVARDFDAAISKGKAAVAENPSDKTTLGNAYMAIGYGYAYKGDKATAKKFLQKYLPYCVAGCDQVKGYIAAP